MHPRTYSSYMKHNILVHLVLRLDLGIFLNHILFFVLLLLFLFTEVSAKNHQFIMSHDLWRNANNRAPSHIIYQSEILQISYPWARFHKIHQLAVVFAVQSCKVLGTIDLKIWLANRNYLSCFSLSIQAIIENDVEYFHCI